VDDAVDRVGRLGVGGRVAGLETAALVDRHVDQHRAGLHLLEVLAPDQLGRGGPGGQHRADDHVGLEDLVLDGGQGRIAGQDAALIQVVQLAHPGDRAFQHHHLGAQAGGHARGVRADHAAAQHRHPGRGHAGHAAQQQAHAAVVLEQGLGGAEHRDAAGHFRHRGQQRQAAARVGDGLVGDGRAARGQQSLGLGRIRRQVEIGEQDVAGRQALPLDLLRFLDLDDQLGAGEHRVGVGRDGRAGLDVEVVAIAGPQARAGLDQHRVTMTHILAHGGGGQADAVFARFDLGRHSNAHDHLLQMVFDAGLRLGDCRFPGSFMRP
jgi:hypothetical protein